MAPQEKAKEPSESVRFLLWGKWLSVQNFLTIHQHVAEIFQSWTKVVDRLTEITASHCKITPDIHWKPQIDDIKQCQRGWSEECFSLEHTWTQQRHQRWVHSQSACSALHQNPAEEEFNQVIFHISHSQKIKKRSHVSNCREAEPHLHPHPLSPCVLHPFPL